MGYPKDPGFVNATWFNRSHLKNYWELDHKNGDHFGFNFSLLNNTIFRGAMDFCPTPPPPEAPPMLHGDDLGWVVDGASQREVGAREAAAHRRFGSIPGLLLGTLVVAALERQGAL